MAAQKGSALLMKIGDGASPEAFTTIGGMRSTSMTLNDEMVAYNSIITAHSILKSVDEAKSIFKIIFYYNYYVMLCTTLN